MSTGRRAIDLLRGYVNQEWERIRGVGESDAGTELDEPAAFARTERTVTVQREYSPAELDDWARRVLGLGSTAEFSEIRKAFVRLNTRADPSKFPSGSAEARQAADIQLRVQQAYAILSESVDTTEKRFKSLEIE